MEIRLLLEGLHHSRRAVRLVDEKKHRPICYRHGICAQSAGAVCMNRKRRVESCAKRKSAGGARIFCAGQIAGGNGRYSGKIRNRVVTRLIGSKEEVP